MGDFVRIEGLTELELKCKEMETGLEREITAINREASELVAAETRSRAPRGGRDSHDKHPGRLASTVKAGATRKFGYVSVGSDLTPYAKAIVFGWPKHNIKANRFPYEALDAKRDAVFTLYGDRVEGLMVRVFGNEG